MSRFRVTGTAVGLAAAVVAVVAPGAVANSRVAGPAAPAITASASSTVVVATTQVTPPIVSSRFIGMHGVPTSSNSGAAGASTEWGVGSVELLLYWSTVQPHRGVWDFAVIDSGIEQVRRSGTGSVLVTILGTPQWAAESVKPGDLQPGFGAAPKNMDDWRLFIRQLSAHVQGKVDAYQIGAEVTLDRTWRGTFTQLATMTAIARQEIKMQDSKPLIVSGSTTVRLASWKPKFRSFVAAMKKAGWPADVISANLYGPATATPVDRQARLAEVKAILREYGAPSRPIWETEINYGVPGPGAIPYVNLDSRLGAGYVLRTYLDALRFGISRVYWSAWVPKTEVYGVTMQPGTYGAQAVRTTHDWLIGKRWFGCSKSGVLVSCRVGLTVGKTGPLAVILFSEGATVRYIVPRGVTTVCPTVGRCAPVRTGDVLRIGGVPVRLS